MPPKGVHRPQHWGRGTRTCHTQNLHTVPADPEADDLTVLMFGL